MRKLNTKDAFRVMHILKNAGMKKDIAEAVGLIIKARGSAKPEDADALGEKLFGILFDLMGHSAAEAGAYALLSDISGKSSKEIQEQSMADTIQMFKEIGAENNLISFLGQASPTT